MFEASELYDAILKGNAKKAEEVTKAALAANVDPSELVRGRFIVPAMDEVGKQFELAERLLRSGTADRRPSDENLIGLDYPASDQKRYRTGRTGGNRYGSR